MTRVYNYRAPRIPHRDLARHRVMLGAAPLPPIVSQRAIQVPVINQGPLGECTGASGGGGVGALSRRQINDGTWSGPPLIASGMGIYYLERAIDGTTDTDSGSSLADTVQVLSQTGVMLESDWPYDLDNAYTAPPATALAAAAKVKLADYAPLDHDLDTLRATLAQGFPIQFAIQVYASFETAPRGDIVMPQDGESLLGGHALLLVGYSDLTQRFDFRNSWGTDWGTDGYGTIPYSYVLDPDQCNELYAYRRLSQTP